MSSALAHSSARVLEFESLRDLLRGYASSPLGQGRIAALAPSTDRVWIETQQALASEIREFRRVGGRFDFSALVDIGSLLEKSRIAGAALETTEIRDVILVVDRAAEWRQIALQPPAAMRSEWTNVRSLSGRIVDFTDFVLSATRFSPTERSTTKPRLNSPASAAKSKSSAVPSRNPCEAICAASPKAAACRMS